MTITLGSSNPRLARFTRTPNLDDTHHGTLGAKPIHQDTVEDSWSHAQAAHKLTGQKYRLGRDIKSGDTGIVVVTGC